jgi:hypothetical protein
METLAPSKEEHFELCNLLNIPRLQDHPDYADWSIQLGRFECFNMIKSMLNDCQSISIGDNQTLEKRRAPPGRLSKLLRDSMMYQYYIAKQTGSTTIFKFDPSQQVSEVSLLKDIVSSETLGRFAKQNLNDIKNISFSYKGLKEGIFKKTGMTTY